MNDPTAPPMGNPSRLPGILRLMTLAGVVLCSALPSMAATRLGIELAGHLGSAKISDSSLQSPPDEGRHRASFGIGPVVDWKFSHGWGGSVALRYDELSYGSHEFAIGVLGDPNALWTDRALKFRQITLAPSASIRLLPRLALRLTPEAVVLLSARQEDELVPGPSPGFVVTPIRYSTAGTIFEQVGSLSDQDVTDRYERVQFGLAGEVAYEQPVGAHWLRLALGMHSYSALGPNEERAYWDWRTSLTWLH